MISPGSVQSVIWRIVLLNSSLVLASGSSIKILITSLNSDDVCSAFKSRPEVKNLWVVLHSPVSKILLTSRRRPTSWSRGRTSRTYAARPEFSNTFFQKSEKAAVLRQKTSYKPSTINRGIRWITRSLLPRKGSRLSWKHCWSWFWP